MALKTWIDIGHKYLLQFIRFVFNVFLGTGAKVPPVTNDILQESAISLASKIRKRQLTSVQVLEAFIQRIQEINPLLNCVVDNRFNEALKDAADVDALIASGQFTEADLELDKPFLGVPLSTKDCLEVEGMLHTSGLWVRKNTRGKTDADALALMKKAGAIIFALTNVSECCMWWESNNPVHGRSRNPYDTNRIVGGSSGGEACLLAASGSPIGIGSDIGGSIRMPAFFNGIFGHKPSKCIVSNNGQWPMPIDIQHQQFLGIGPMSRFACDLKPVLKIISNDKAASLDLDRPINIRKLRIFYQYDNGGGFLVSPVDKDIQLAMEKVVKHFEQICEKKPKKLQISLLKKSTEIWLANMKSSQNAKGFDYQLLDLKGKINPYVELMKWCIGQSNHTFIAIMTALTDTAGHKVGTSRHSHRVRQKNNMTEEFNALLGNDGVFLYPTHPTVAPYHNEPIFRAFNFSYTGIVNVLGLPATSIPMGIGSEGLPLGFQVVANDKQDVLCLAIAEEIEKTFGGFKKPSI